MDDKAMGKSRKTTRDNPGGCAVSLKMVAALVVVISVLVPLTKGDYYSFFAVVAFFAVLFAGRYPKALFEFNVGVLRWSWRVCFYSYGALGTDTYPPFTLASTDYPADLDVEYTEDMARWKPLVKWLFAVPHYACLAALSGGNWGNLPHIGLLPVLIVIIAVLLLFTGKYLKDIWQLVMGVNRWSFRVAAYVLLLTDEYPPFSLSE